MLSMYNILKQLSLFQGITTDHLTRILEVTPFDFRNYNEGEVVSQSGTTLDSLISVISGRVSVTSTVCGRVSVIQTYEAPYTLPFHHLYGADTSATATVIADADKTGIMVMHKRDFRRILHENEVAMINALNILCTKAQRESHTADFCLETEPVLRLARWLQTFADRYAKETVFDATETAWTEVLQLDAASFWRSVAMLEGTRAIECVSGRIKLTDRYYLQSYIATKTAQKK